MPLIFFLYLDYKQPYHDFSMQTLNYWDTITSLQSMRICARLSENMPMQCSVIQGSAGKFGGEVIVVGEF